MEESQNWRENTTLLLFKKQRGESSLFTYTTATGSLTQNHINSKTCTVITRAERALSSSRFD